MNNSKCFPHVHQHSNGSSVSNLTFTRGKYNNNKYVTSRHPVSCKIILSLCVEFNLNFLILDDR